MADTIVRSSFSGSLTNSGQGAVVLTRAGEIVASNAFAALDFATFDADIAALSSQGTIINYDVTSGDAISYERTDFETGGRFDVTLGATSHVEALGGNGVFLNGEAATVYNAGFIRGATYGLASNDTVTIENAGAITGGDSGLALFLSGGASANILNTGTISGQSGDGITLSGTGGALYLVNLGRIASETEPTFHYAVLGDDQLDSVDNLGEIAGNFGLAGGNDGLENSGKIVGNVELGAGSDFLSNSGVIQGTVDLGSGDDLLRNTGTIEGRLVTNGGSRNGVAYGDDIENLGAIIGNVDMSVGANHRLTNTGNILGKITGGNFIDNAGTLGETAWSTWVIDEARFVLNSGHIHGSIFYSGEFDSFGQTRLDNSGEISGSFVFDASTAQITNEGSIQRVFGDVEESGRLINTGTVFGSSFDGPVVDFAGAGDADVFNSGTIRGVLLETSNASFENAGEVVGSIEALVRTGLDAGVVRVHNSGTVSADVVLNGSDGAVVNAGKISGSVYLINDIDSVATFRMGDQGTVAGTVYGQDGEDLIVGGMLDDRINGGRQVDDLRGGGGDDLIRGHSGNDSIEGGSGDDDLYGGGGGDQIRGGHGNDYLFGSSGRDTLMGNAGADELDGGNFDDVLNGGRGADILTGGSGSDTFVFGLSAGSDLITDFENGVDMIDLAAYELEPGDLDGAGVVTRLAGATVVDLTLLRRAR